MKLIVFVDGSSYSVSVCDHAAWAAKRNPMVKTTYTVSTGLVWAIPFRKDDTAGRALVSNVVKCMKQDGTVTKLAVKWFGFQPDVNDAAVKIAPGTGVPDMDGYDATPVTPKCA